MSARRELCFLACLCLIQLAYGDGRVKLIRPKMLIKNGTTHTRISNGQAAREGQFPYMVFMMYKASNGELSRCSASLVAMDKVLLAAHCFSGDQNINPLNVLLVAGKADLNNYVDERLRISYSQAVDENALQVQERRAEEVQIMPNFKECSVTCNHDVALVSVKTPFRRSDTVDIIPISRVPITQQATCSILGWGFKENNVDDLRLMYGTLIHAAPVSECKYKSVGEFYCLKSRTAGICQGDSGSPLVCDNQAVGVASHTLSKSTEAMCGEDMEEYYAALFPEMYWLEPLLASQPNRGPTDTQTNTAVDLKTSLVCFPILMLIIKL